MSVFIKDAFIFNSGILQITLNNGSTSGSNAWPGCFQWKFLFMLHLNKSVKIRIRWITREFVVWCLCCKIKSTMTTEQHFHTLQNVFLCSHRIRVTLYIYMYGTWQHENKKHHKWKKWALRCDRKKKWRWQFSRLDVTLAKLKLLFVRLRSVVRAQASKTMRFLRERYLN